MFQHLDSMYIMPTEAERTSYAASLTHLGILLTHLDRWLRFRSKLLSNCEKLEVMREDRRHPRERWDRHFENGEFTRTISPRHCKPNLRLSRELKRLLLGSWYLRRPTLKQSFALTRHPIPTNLVCRSLKQWKRPSRNSDNGSGRKDHWCAPRPENSRDSKSWQGMRKNYQEEY